MCSTGVPKGNAELPVVVPLFRQELRPSHGKKWSGEPSSIEE